MLDGTSLQQLPAEAVRATIPSPVGPVTVVASDHGVHAVSWDMRNDEGSGPNGYGTAGFDGDAPLSDRQVAPVLAGLREDPHHAVARVALSQLREYFSGRRETFALPLRPLGSAFQRAVWHELSMIPFGQTRAYHEVASAVGGAEKVRAVGRAVGKNPLSVVVPCHRVIGKDRTLTGFAGGLDRKAYLLSLEGIALSPANEGPARKRRVLTL